jgi:glutaminyl-peptide cyclotransferase
VPGRRSPSYVTAWSVRRHNRLVRFHRVQVVRRAPHPGRGFTQGLIAAGGTVWESTGNYGESLLTRYELGAAAPAAQARLAPELFGEGICRVGDSIWQLTWRERVALRWDAETLELRGKVRYNRDGWGICAVGGDADPTGTAAPVGEAARGEVVTSDGTSELVRRDSATLEPRAVIHVRSQGSWVRGLNDLAWSGGLVWANVAGTTCLAGINLATGEVSDVVDARAAAERHWADQQAIMNGIAALDQPGEFLLTGKGWRSIRRVRLVADRDRGHRERLLRGLSR